MELIPRYVPLIQKPHLCAAACLQMIIFRNGLGLFEQEEIAKDLEIKVSERSAAIFSEDVQVGTAHELGLDTMQSVDRINSFFLSRNLPLRVHGYRFAEGLDIGSFLLSELGRGSDLWVEYSAAEIHAFDHLSGKYMHDGLIESYDRGTGQVCLIDPMPEHRQRLSLHLPDLVRSISGEHGKLGGFLVVTKAKVSE